MQLTAHKADFHCHSNASDGELTPEALMMLARERNIETLSLTDHDTLAGAARVRKALPEGLRLIPGVELSCQWRKVNIHVLAYDFDWEDASMKALLSAQQSRRQERAARIAEKLEKKLRIQGVLADVRQRIGDGVPGRPHFAAVLVERGVVASEPAAFDQYLGSGKIGDVSICWPTLEELMAALQSTRSFVVIAHPVHYRMTATKLREFMDDFQGLGGEGIEIAVPGINSGHYGWLTEEARKRQLVQSFGSDYHGGRQFGRALGAYPAPVAGLPSIMERLSV